MEASKENIQTDGTECCRQHKMIRVVNQQSKVKVNVPRLRNNLGIARRALLVDPKLGINVWLMKDKDVAHMNKYDRKAPGATDILSYANYVRLILLSKGIALTTHRLSSRQHNPSQLKVCRWATS